MEHASPYHAVLMFLAVFGAAAIWFTGYILIIKLRPLPPADSNRWERGGFYAGNRLWGVAIAVPTVIYVLIIAYFW